MSQKIYLAWLLSSLKLKESISSTRLGFLWWFIEPLLLIILYYYLVEIIFGSHHPDALASLAIGVVLWKWWHAAILSATKSIVKYKRLIQEIKFPTILIPISDVVGQTLLFLVAFMVVVLLSFFSHDWYLIDFVLLSFLLVSNIIFLCVICVALAVINVYLRDVGMIINFVLRILFYATPIIYSSSRVPKEYRWVIDVNPFARYLDSYREVIFNHELSNMVFPSVIFLAGMLVLILANHAMDVGRATINRAI